MVWKLTVPVFYLKNFISCFVSCETQIHWWNEFHFAKNYFPIGNGIIKKLEKDSHIKSQPTNPINLVIDFQLIAQILTSHKLVTLVQSAWTYHLHSSLCLYFSPIDLLSCV